MYKMSEKWTLKFKFCVCELTLDAVRSTWIWSNGSSIKEIQKVQAHQKFQKHIFVHISGTS